MLVKICKLRIMGCIYSVNFPKYTFLNSLPLTSVPDKSLVEGNNEEVALLFSLALYARIDQALKKFHTCFLSQARIDFSLRLGMFYGALLYVFVLMQSQNPLFYGLCAASLAWSALFLCRGRMSISKTFFLHVIDRGSLGSPRQIHAVPQVQTRTSEVWRNGRNTSNCP